MRPLMIIALAIVSVSCQSAAQDRAAQDRAQAAPPDVVAMERAALDRWGKATLRGISVIMANEVTYSTRRRRSAWTAWRRCGRCWRR